MMTVKSLGKPLNSQNQRLTNKTKDIIKRKPADGIRYSVPNATDSVLNMSKVNSKTEWGKSSLVKIEEEDSK
jgi:hypothetical protein